MDKNWLQEKRDLFVKDVVKDFLDCHAFFMDLKEHTARYGVRYDGFDFWVGTEQDKGKLWQLKDLCHMLWGDSDPANNGHGFMLDWMIGAVFHEAMKLKENAYMIERYRQSFPFKKTTLIRPNGRADSSVQDFFEETALEIKRTIKRIDCLLDHAEAYLVAVLGDEKENALLVRYLLEEEISPGEHRSEDVGTSKLLKTLFPSGLDEAYCLAGESYLEGSWFTEARLAFEKALEINPKCMEALSGLRLLEKRLEEITAVLEREYEIRVQKNGNFTARQ